MAGRPRAAGGQLAKGFALDTPGPPPSVVRRGARDARVTQPPLRLRPIRGSSR